MNSFMENLISYLEGQDLTVSDLARKSGINDQTIYSWRNLDRFPRLDYAIKIAEALGVSVDFLATGETKLYGLHPAQKKLLTIMNSLKDEDKWRLLGIVEGLLVTEVNPQLHHE
jgi:transcriptional regulator with XRE-family HTH domain